MIVLDVWTGASKRNFKCHWKLREIILQFYFTYCLDRKPAKPQVRNTARHSANIIKVSNITKQINWTNPNWFTHWKFWNKLSFFTMEPFPAHPEAHSAHWSTLRHSLLIPLKYQPQSQPRRQKHSWAPCHHYYSAHKSINPCTHLFIQWRWKLWVSVRASHL